MPYNLNHQLNQRSTNMDVEGKPISNQYYIYEGPNYEFSEKERKGFRRNCTFLPNKAYNCFVRDKQKPRPLN